MKNGSRIPYRHTCNPCEGKIREIAPDFMQTDIVERHGIVYNKKRGNIFLGMHLGNRIISGNAVLYKRFA